MTEKHTKPVDDMRTQMLHWKQSNTPAENVSTAPVPFTYLQTHGRNDPFDRLQPVNAFAAQRNELVIPVCQLP